MNSALTEHRQFTDVQLAPILLRKSKRKASLSNARFVMATPGNIHRGSHRTSGDHGPFLNLVTLLGKTLPKEAEG